LDFLNICGRTETRAAVLGYTPPSDQGNVMTKAAADELAHLQAVWLDRFGEPPPIIAEPEIMRRVMARVLGRIDAESPRTAGSGGLEEAVGP
jgi:hypothetical protein